MIEKCNFLFLHDRTASFLVIPGDMMLGAFNDEFKEFLSAKWNTFQLLIQFAIGVKCWALKFLECGVDCARKRKLVNSGETAEVRSGQNR